MSYYVFLNDNACFSMQQVTISPKFQVVIPRKIRESLKLVPGQKIQVVQYGERIELIPHKEAHEMRGFLKKYETRSSGPEGGYESCG